MTPGIRVTRLQQWFKSHNIRISTRLGQHFLINEDVMARILEYADLASDDCVLEIGTGDGSLTKALARHVQRVYTIEKDEKLFGILSQELASNTRIQLIHGDAAKIRWPESDKLVANLPYRISSPVLFKFFDTKIPLAVLMLQKEFGERLTAQSGTKQYGRLTVMTAFYANVELLEVVSPESFFPPPEVSSVVVRVHRLKVPSFLVKDERLFGEVTTILFNQRRKKIRTPLKSFLGQPKFHQIKRRIPWLDKRVEELEPHQIAEISNIIYEVRQL